MLCDDCQKKHNNWIQHPAPPGRTEDRTPTLTLNNMRNHAEDWRKTVRYQTRLIRQICQEKHHA